MVNVPAAESKPSSDPVVLAVRAIVAASGFATTEVNVFASNNSTHENIKHKNAATTI